MMIQTSKTPYLNNIPPRKLALALEGTVKACETCGPKNLKLDQTCKTCQIRNDSLIRYAGANIPVIYWDLEMNRNYEGDEILLKKYQELTSDLMQTYKQGISLCFAGGFGVGKTLSVCCILKRAVERGFSALYVNLTDMVNVLLYAEEKHQARKDLLMVDFIVIDEFDPRYIMGEKSGELFGKILEEVFRNRTQNGLPNFFCTNSANVVESFTGPLKQSIGSLFANVRTIPVLGKDFRRGGKK